MGMLGMTAYAVRPNRPVQSNLVYGVGIILEHVGWAAMPNTLYRLTTKPAQYNLKTRSYFFNFRFNRTHGHVGHDCPTYRDEL